MIIDLDEANQENEGLYNRAPDTACFWNRRGAVGVLENPVLTCGDAVCHDPLHMGEGGLAGLRNRSDHTITNIIALLEDYILDDDPVLNEQLKQEMEHHNLLELLPGSVHGFALRDRKWRKFLKQERGNGWLTC